MKTRSKKLSDDYLRLVQSFPLVKIRSQKQCDEATAVIEPLAVRGESGLTSGEADYLYAMTDLIAAFEQQQHQTASDATPLETLKYLIEEHDMTASDLGRLLNNRGLGTLILNGKRELSKSHIRTLAERFGISAAAFL